MKNVLQGHGVVALDTSVWIYHFEDHPTYRKCTEYLLGHITDGYSRAIVSELTLLELLIKPLRLRRQDIADHYEALLTHFPNVSLQPVSREVVIRAAALRARYSFRTPDALIMATALVHKATLILTNDERWKRLPEPAVLCLSELDEPATDLRP